MMGLEWLCGSMRESYGLKVDIEGPDICEVSESLNILIFRAVRELLFNVVKHAGVDRAFIEVEQPNPCSLRIIVRDQGRGFSPNASEKFGLFGLRERITYIGGTIEVESTPQKGTRISFAVPLNSAAPNGHLVVSNDAIKTASLSDTRKAKYQVLVVDDHAVLRQGLMELLDKEEDITVISAASDGKQAIEKTRMLHPDIVLMDISMPGMSGIEATRIIMDEMPGTKVIGLSMYDQVEMRRAMHEAGAAAYLCKGGPIEDILSTIRSFPPVRKSDILKP
jgi:CheY-like chemotaxis protein